MSDTQTVTLDDLGVDPLEGVDEKAVQRSIAGAQPLMEDPPDNSFTLPRGISDGVSFNGDVVIRELDGSDEETLAKVKDFMTWYDTVLALGVSRIGHRDLEALELPQRLVIVRSLLTGERRMLFMWIVRVNFGDHRTFSFICQNEACKAEIEADVDLSTSFIPTPMEKVQELYEYTTTGQTPQTISFRLPVGFDEVEVVSIGGTGAEQNSKMLAQCVEKLNGKEIVDKDRFVRKLTMRDRKGLLGVISSLQSQLDMELEAECPTCRTKNTYMMGFLNFFRD